MFSHWHVRPMALPQARSSSRCRLALGLGWIGVELVLQPLGLLTGTLGGGLFFNLVGNALGYVLVAFLVAAVRASLLAVLSTARLATPRHRARAALPCRGEHLSSQTPFSFQLLALRQLHPRAPPSQIVSMR